MKKTLKVICGMSLTLALGVLSLLVVNENQSAEAANSTKVVIDFGEACTCSWTGGSDFNFGTFNSSDSTQKGYATGKVAVSDTAEGKRYCKVTATALTTGSNSIAVGNLKIKSTVLTRLAGNLNTGGNVTDYTALSPVSVYTKNANVVGKGEMTTPMELTIPAFTVPGTYAGSITVECTDK